jgi:hypothetical protein
MAVEFTFSGTAVAIPTLSTCTFTKIRIEIADYLGWTRTAGNWSATQSARLGVMLNHGYQQFLFPPKLPGEQNAHRWSFMKPVTTLNTVADEDAYDLPEAFGGLVGDITFASGDNVTHAIELISEPKLRKLQSQIDGATTGKPQYAAIRPTGVNMGAIQVRELILWPTPDAVYVLTYQYDARLSDWSTAAEYPLGGQEHCLTLLQSCRDIAAHTLNNPDLAVGEHARFMERLQASVEQDRKHAPTTLGYMGPGDRHEITRHGTGFTVTHA